MTKLIYASLALTAIPILFACSSQKKSADGPSEQEVMIAKIPHVRGSKPVTAIPQATAFRMNGDYADNVAITLGDDGKISYYPAPSDLTAASRPIDLGNGWYLNRQGIGYGSVFTRYTFDQYSSLKKAPSRKELLESVIPGSGIELIVELPFTVGEAPQNLDSIRRYVAEPHRKPSILRPKY